MFHLSGRTPFTFSEIRIGNYFFPSISLSIQARASKSLGLGLLSGAMKKRRKEPESEDLSFFLVTSLLAASLLL